MRPRTHWEQVPSVGVRVATITTMLENALGSAQLSSQLDIVYLIYVGCMDSVGKMEWLSEKWKQNNTKRRKERN